MIGLFRSKPAIAPTGAAAHSAGLPHGMTELTTDALPPLYEFDDIVVMPTQSEEGMVAKAGPIWPDWDGAATVRHRRHHHAVDSRPQDPGALASIEILDGSAAWGGHAVDHFGHWLAEHSTRLLHLAILASADSQVLFTLPNGVRANMLPAFFWQTLAWYGIDAERVRFVTKPLRVAHLYAAPMAELWAGAAPTEAYLNALDGRIVGQLGHTNPEGTIYVTRDGVAAGGAGHNAGESYLASCLKHLGVTVLHPESRPLTDQLRAYASADQLIFSEGSALHGRQLIGRMAQHIVVLNRRKQTRIAKDALQPRCTRLTYCDVTHDELNVYFRDGRPWPVRALSLYDVSALLEQLDYVGMQLAEIWDQTAFEAARDADIRRWIKLRFEQRRPLDVQKSVSAIREVLERNNLAHLASALPNPVAVF